jgi:hypothetical protein
MGGGGGLNCSGGKGGTVPRVTQWLPKCCADSMSHCSHLAFVTKNAEVSLLPSPYLFASTAWELLEGFL